ncbi:MAG TPA: hypothetical protein PK156_34610 [Polyangium sp.]|nr:hypothetical protein [Polyangium sp.]
MDYLFLRKVQNPPPDDTGQTLHRLWPLIPQAAIGEFKSIGRPYRARELDRLYSYLHTYWVDTANLKDRHDLIGVLFVPDRTPSLDADVASMGLQYCDMDDGYWEITGGLFRVYLVELDRVGATEPDGVLASFGHNVVPTREAAQFWAEMVGTKEAGMGAENLEGYNEIMAHVLEKLPPELRLAGLSPDQVVLTLPNEVLCGLSESYIATLPAHVREEIRRRLER